MNVFSNPAVLLLVVTWPLLLAAGLLVGTTRALSLRLVPWAALPALLAALALADTRLPLPGVLLDSALVLDSAGRVFLLLGAGLWLVTGLFGRMQLQDAAASRSALLQLLAMTGSLGLVLAGDALLFFAAATLAGYALYGLLVNDAGGASQKAGRVLAVLLVVSDLLVFELLLMLGRLSGSMEFASLRQALLNADQQGLILVLLIAGFGIKAGVVGVHFWLAPVFVTAARAVRPALVAFMFTAGMLGWLRLLPLGELHWSAAGSVLQWLVWTALGYAVLAGLLQIHFRSLLACAAVALSAFWLATLASALQFPQAWQGLEDVMAAAVLQSGFALGALLLFRHPAAAALAPGWCRLHAAAMWLAALLLAATPAGIAVLLLPVDARAALQLHALLAAITFLVVRGRLLAGSRSQGAGNTLGSRDAGPRGARSSVPGDLLLIGALTAAALLAAVANLGGLSFAQSWRPLLTLSAGAFLAWLSVSRIMPVLPVLPPGDLLVPVSNGLHAVLEYGRRLFGMRLPLWYAAYQVSLRCAWSAVNGWKMTERIEYGLASWRNVLVFLLLLGLLLAWWGGYR